MCDDDQLVKTISKKLTYYQQKAAKYERRLMMLVDNDPYYSNADSETEEEVDAKPSALFHHLVHITGKHSDRVPVKDLLPFFKAFGYFHSCTELGKWIGNHVKDLDGVRYVTTNHRLSIRGVTLGMPIPDCFRE
jgi:hypothetical protein